MASISSLLSPTIQQQCYIFSLSSLVILRTHLYLFFSVILLLHIQLHLVSDCGWLKAICSIVIRGRSIQFSSRSVWEDEKKTVKLYCLLIVLLMFNSCWLIKGDTAQNELYTVTQMEPREHMEECVMIILLISISFLKSCMRNRTLCLHN